MVEKKTCETARREGGNFICTMDESICSNPNGDKCYRVGLHAYGINKDREVPRSIAYIPVTEGNRIFNQRL